ncbi:SDR family NAD(P)-dependent oxidoreductase [Streptomyces sp. NPDC001177]
MLRPDLRTARTTKAEDSGFPRELARLEPVAIIGMGCRFPGGIEDPRSFWDVIASGTDAIVDVPPDRWRTDAFFDEDLGTPGRMTVRQGGFLRSPVDRFDAAFFGMPPREAAALDPQQRLLLEVAWEAFEDAGLPPSRTAATNVGCYIGGFTFDAAVQQLGDTNRDLISSSTPTGVSMTMLAARLSYVFDWRGPSLTMDTACSSSLVALHHACAALSRGECDLAVAGGVNVMSNPITTILMSKGQFLSPDARCKSFDHRADGYARGEGAGIVLLKPLVAAVRDGDHIHAVVRGTAVNQDGRSPGITVPSAEAQRTVIRQACRSGGVEPTSVLYYEAHGTGTAVGDPIEATSIGDVLKGSDTTHWIGSVKSNIGHTEAAAGVAGVIKASLCLQRGLIPPNLHFERPNPQIPFDAMPLRVPTEMVRFPEQQNGPRRAGINSFGFGGTNAHAILEQAPATRHADGPADHEADDGRPQLLPLSARSPEALRALADAYAQMLERSQGPALRRICRAAARQREHHPLRTFVVADEPARAAKKLRESTIDARRATREGVAFVYTGMGPQWWGMGRELLREEPRFAEVVAACDAVLTRFDLSIADELLREEAASRLTETLYAQVANFVVQAGLTALWRDWGIEPTVIVGHSVGEVAAAYAAGVYTLEDTLTISYHRARLQARLAGRGVMAAVNLPADTVWPYLVDGVSVAAINSVNTTTIAGDPDAMAVATERLQVAGASVRPLRVEVAYHSAQMDEIREPLLADLRGIRPSPARKPLVSTVTGSRVDGSELDAGYWWRNVRQPVQFAAAMQQVVAMAPAAVVEVGPHPVLAPAIDEALAEDGGNTVHLASLRRDQPQLHQLQETLGALYAAGAEPDWARVHPGPREYLVLPRYPWQRERHWTESPASREARLGAGGPRLAGRTVAAATPTRDIELSAAEFPYLADHRIGRTVVFPGSGYIEAALAMFPTENPCFLEDVVFHRPLTLAPRSIATLRTGYDPVQRVVTLHSREQHDAAWSLHAQLRNSHSAHPPRPLPRAGTLADLTRSLPEIGHDQVYALLDRSNLNYGPAFRAIDRLWYRGETGEVFAELRADTVDTEGYRLHPALLDAALQAVIAGALGFADDVPAATYVPARIAELRFFRSPGKRLWLHGRDRRSTVAGRLECDLTLVTDENEVVAEVIGLRAQRLAKSRTDEPTPPEELYYEHVWRPEQHESGGSANGSWIVVGSSVTAVALVHRLRTKGATALHTTLADDDWTDRVVNAVSEEPACRGVVFVSDSGAADAPACASVAAPLRLVQALSDASVPLFLVTSGAQSVAADDATTDPFSASLWGFGRVVGAERPELRCRLIDINTQDRTDSDHVEPLIGELCHNGLDEVALRGDTRYVRRLQHAGDRSALHHVRTRTDRTPVRLRPGDSGVDSLRFAATSRRAPEPTEVEIEVAHTGLNFKDVLKVTGLLSSEVMEGSHSQETLGLECSGTVIRVGEAVADLRPGDEVFAHSSDLFSSHVTLDQVRVVKKPAALSLAQAASLLPAVTAYQSLVRLAQVRRGERVLVHSAAGGVGLAAVRIATWLGAEVYATAGTEERRSFLRAEGVAGVSDSQSTTFADDILGWTDGAGVDVVVNSLPGEILHKSLALLGPFGRFVELGKAAMAADHVLRLAPFHRALSFHAFDYDQMMLLRPELVRDCMRELAELYERKAFAPLPVTEVPARKVDAAFRAMTRRGHIGKLVVRLAREPVTVPASSVAGSSGPSDPSESSDAPVRTGATYLITGGLGGLGLTVAQWLADRGARHLVLIGRRGIVTDDAQRAVNRLISQGVEVRVEQADVVDRNVVKDLLARVRTQLPPLRGIIHGAADFDDVPLSDTDAARLVAATGPKADGAWNLHLETQPDDLDFFVLLSSIAAQLGAVAAGAYATANEFLNALARHRHSHGLPATSVGWGMIDDVGVAVSRNGTVGNILRRNGHLGMSPAQLTAQLETLLRTQPVEVSVADIDWRRWAQANPQLAPLPSYDSLVPSDALDSGSEASVAQRIRKAAPAERVSLLAELIVPLLQRITGLSEEQLSDQQSVDIDSLSGVELRVMLQNTLGVSVPAVRLQRNLTVDGLAGLLADELDRTPTDSFHPLDSITAHTFASSDGLTVHGHLSVPAGPGPHPAVVVCTSGRGGALDEEGRYVHISEHAPLHAAGFAVFTVDQRGAPGHGADFSARAEMGEGDIDDVVAAARYLTELPEIDATRLSIVGTSRGAYSALLALAREPSLWHRAALIMGLYDPALLVSAETSRPGTLLPTRSGIGATEIQAHFTDPRRQPLSMLDAVTAPLLLVHGDADEVVPLSQAHDAAERAERLGLTVQLVTVAGLGHDNDHTDAGWGELWPQIAHFLGEEPA